MKVLQFLARWLVVWPITRVVLLVGVIGLGAIVALSLFILGTVCAVILIGAGAILATLALGVALVVGLVPIFIGPAKLKELHQKAGDVIREKGGAS